MNENPLQGSFIIDELTDLVEEAVLAEFDRITERGGVLGAMETGYQRGRIQDESMLYEHRKHDGIAADHRGQHLPSARAATPRRRRSSWPGRPRRRSSRQLDRLADFHARHADRGRGGAAPAAGRRAPAAATCSTC